MLISRIDQRARLTPLTTGIIPPPRCLGEDENEHIDDGEIEI